MNWKFLLEVNSDKIFFLCDSSNFFIIYDLFLPKGVPPGISIPVPDPQPPVGINVSVGEDVCLPFGQSANISCVATSGTEPISYSWTRHSSSTVISTASTLTVGQTGTYNCTATNAFGSDTASTTVFGKLWQFFCKAIYIYIQSFFFLFRGYQSIIRAIFFICVQQM